MHLKYIYPLLLVFILAVSGCTAIKSSQGWPEPRPLADDLTSFRPSVAPDDGDTSFSIADSDSLTLGRALAWTLMNNPELQTFAFEVRAREAERVQAGRWLNPTLGVEAEEVSAVAPLSELTGGEQVARLGQRIPLGGDVDSREDVAAAERDLAGWDYEATRLGVITDVRQSFAGVLAAQRRLALARDLEALAEELYRTVAAQVDAGQISPVELDRVSVERAQARIEAGRAEELLQAGRQRLAAALGATALPFEGVRGDFADIRPVPPLEVLSPLLTRNPRLARFSTVRRWREAQIDLEWAELIPDPSVNGGVQRFGATGERAFAIGLSIPIPLFDRNHGAIEAAQSRLMKALRAQQEAKAEVVADLESAYRNLSASYNEVRHLREEALPSARSAYVSYREGYRLGKFDLLRVLDAQEALFEAQLQLVRALRRYHRSSAEVEQITATPLKEVNRSDNE